MLHTMYFADEVRDFGEIDKGQSAKIRDRASWTWRSSSSTACPTTSSSQSSTRTSTAQRVLDLVNQKVEGKEVTVAAPEAPRAQVIDLMEALKESLAKRVASGEKRPLAKAKRSEEAAPAPPNEPRRRSSVRGLER